MPETRLHQLLKFLEEDPRDPFNLYAVALEYIKTDPQKAVPFFELLMDRHAEYVPSYYHYATLLVDLGQSERAKKILQVGIGIASKSGDLKAVKEMQNILSELEFDL